ncbi:hypothetical protein RHS04_08481 [Rhizoctonia solani]|uniref:Uncharacterized protein n=1 Tax=Rhizoctonia solani TaxID=456999 RepID=A0A8H7LFN6_9AGAM|nr:hypothetical protein RHS04_08481 [Rhizoctonia solani]
MTIDPSSKISIEKGYLDGAQRVRGGSGASWCCCCNDGESSDHPTIEPQPYDERIYEHQQASISQPSQQIQPDLAPQAQETSPRETDTQPGSSQPHSASPLNQPESGDEPPRVPGEGPSVDDTTRGGEIPLPPFMRD